MLLKVWTTMSQHCKTHSLMTVAMPFFYSIFDDQDDPNIDEEIMREYENFVQDLEDHLMMQEFGQT